MLEVPRHSINPHSHPFRTGTFNILAYTDKNAQVPATWADSDPRLITRNAEQVKLRSFSTSVHRVEGLVAYRLGE